MQNDRLIGFDRIDKEEYQRALLSDLDNIIPFYSYSTWYSVWSEYLKTTAVYFKATFESSKPIYLGFIQEQGAKGYIKSYSSGPVGTYSAMHGIGSKNLSDIISAIENTINPSHLVLTFTSHNNLDPLDYLGMSHTYTLDIPDLDASIDTVWSRHHKRQLKKAVEQNYEVYISEDIQEWRLYYSLYKEQINELAGRASNNYRAELFELIHTIPQENRSLWLAKKGDTVLGGRLVFHGQHHASEWHAVHDKSHSGVAQLLIYKILGDLKKKDVLIYDFNPSNGNKGVEEFKEKFGATKQTVYTYEYKGRLAQLYSFYLSTINSR